jgi:hypothetical protein
MSLPHQGAIHLLAHLGLIREENNIVNNATSAVMNQDIG